MPVVHPLQSLSAGGIVGTEFIAEFDPAMHALLFSTYFSGNLGASIPAGIAFDTSGKLHVVGTGPSDMPITSGVFRDTVTPPPLGYSYDFGYVGLIDPAGANPGLCVGGDLNPAAELGTTARDRFQLTNCGLAPLTITATQLSGLGLSLPAPTACDTTIAPGDSCSLPWSFTPEVAPLTAGVLTIDSNAMVKESLLSLDANGILTSGFALDVEPQSLAFGTQQVGTTSAQQTLNLYTESYPAGSQVTIKSIATTGDFSETNLCSAGTPVGQCEVQVSFTPTVGGIRTGTLTIASNAPGSPVQIPLTGQGLSALTATPGSPNLSVTSVGQSATTAIQIESQNGFAGTAALTCTVEFQGQGTAHDLPTCALNPAQIQVSANGSASSTLTVNTTASSSSAVRHASLYWLTGLLLACLLPARRSLRAMGLVILLGCAFACGLAGCGGGSSSPSVPVTPPPPTDSGTTPGNYQVSVTATSATVSVTANVSVVVH
jgi:Abnormal spindle-like microcephaly-assoc'd, ASPM-SPD-2-Hydin